MQSVVFYFNRLLNGAFDLLMAALAWGGASVQLLGASIVVGLVVGGIFKAVLQRQRLTAAQNDLRAFLYEIWIYRMDPRLTVRAQWALLRANLRYVGAFAVPLGLAMAVVLPLLIQLHFRFGLDELSTGSQVLLTAELSDGVEMDGVQVELRWKRGSGEVQAAVREPALRRLVWRLQPTTPGENVLQLKAADQEVEFPLYIEKHAGSIAASRSAGILRQLIEPRGQYLSHAMIFRRIYIDYPAASYDWMVLLTVGSLIAALVANEAAGRFAKRAQR